MPLDLWARVRRAERLLCSRYVAGRRPTVRTEPRFPMSPALLPAASSLPTSSFDPVLPVGAFAAVVQIARNAVDFALCWLKARVMRSAIVDVFGLGFTSKTLTLGFVIGCTVWRSPCARCGACVDRISAHLSQRLPKSTAYLLTCARSRAWRSAACRVGTGEPPRCASPRFRGECRGDGSFRRASVWRREPPSHDTQP